MSSHITTGKTGEALAVYFIETKGYHIIAQNWRAGRSEVDIIAFKEKVLHMFEVKTRIGKQLIPPEASVDYKKMHKLKEAAAAYLYLHPEWKLLQFNIIAITINHSATEILLIEDVY